MKRLSFLAACFVVACGSEEGGDNGSTDDGQGASGGDGSGGSGASSAGATGGTAGDSSGGTGGTGLTGGDGGAAPMPPFEFTLGGQAQTFTQLSVENLQVGGATTCTRELRLDATLAPGPLDTGDPQISLQLCASALPPSGVATLTDSIYDDFWLEYLYFRPGSSNFPKAVGSVTVIQDGQTGIYEGHSEGTIEVDEAPVPYSLKWNQAVDPVP